jgi:hypothetical protein
VNVAAHVHLYTVSDALQAIRLVEAVALLSFLGRTIKSLPYITVDQYLTLAALVTEEYQ